MIHIKVEDNKGEVQNLEIPEGINLNLMETLKAYEYPIRATCGGMALCSDCHCEVLEGWEKLPEAQEQELITLDSRPDASSASRLACQIKLADEINGLSIRLIGESE
ncbi:2Fe-2S iron-sulfur cluster-binding protein [Paradesertivirga mongoliensis]|uniref:2Fe-2S iron-sulfur cluster-binding protein n=1 Tax=Paradesertivirga mongoliensis TaxID=2100740 RepID=A0ABW4ZP86_9SPHI|nr:2Fe-2S iron-sulfur cluster-binding protein [Pedobacter mongoliensis]